MNILYLHGFASAFSPESEKVVTLGELGTVFGITIDYSKPSEEIRRSIYTAILVNNIDLVVGTSMGGWWAADIGSLYGIPFVAINPAMDPANQLKALIGTVANWVTGEKFELTESVVNSYTKIAKDGYGLILLDEGDTVINSAETRIALMPYYIIKTFEGGNHIFTHMKESIALIKAMYESSELIYGTEQKEEWSI